MKKNIDENIWKYWIVAILMAFIFFSCGRKGPPVAPGVPDLEPVTGISYEIEADIIKVSWDKPNSKNESILTGYTVHRSITGIDEESCDGCPVLFKRIAELGADSNSYGELLEKGNKYIYKVVAVSKYGTISPDSEFIKFDY